MFTPQEYKLRLFFIVVSFFTLLYFSFFLTEKYFDKSYKEEIFYAVKEELILKENFTINFIEDSKKTLQNILELDEVKKSIENEYFFNLEKTFKTIVQANNLILQLRYIDINGQEKIRIDRTTDNKIIKINNLQNKYEREYFKKSLERKDIYISKLDLNIENKSVEFPFKPTIRILYPFFIEEKLNGFLSINLRINPLINSNIFETMIINSDMKKVILPYNKEDEKFLFDLSNYFTENEISSLLNNKTFTTNDFISYKINIEGNNIIFVVKLKQNFIEKIESEKIQKRIIILICSIILILFLSIYLFKKINEIFEEHYTFQSNERMENNTDKINSANRFISENIDPELIISQANTSMMLTDENSNILLTNLAFEELFEYEKSEVIGKNPRFLNSTDRKQSGLETLREAIKNRISTTVILRNYTKNNKLKYIELTITPIFDKENKNLKYFLGLHRDVTKEQKILKELKNIF